MRKTSNKSSISRLVEICAVQGLQDVVFSPGSRNAPLIIAFNQDDRFNCICIHDERVAAFYALGISQLTRIPTILSCTSGSAAYNYAPAIAEAFYQRVPLLICTADRPVEWTDQGNGQTIRQRDIYGEHVCGSFELLQEALHPDEIWNNDRIVNEAIIQSLNHERPAHINIPLREPLYEIEKLDNPKPKIINYARSENDLVDDQWFEIAQAWNTAERKLILVGQSQPNSLLTGALTALAVDRSVVVMTETISNVHLSNAVSSIDRTIEGIDKKFQTYQPDLLLTIGGEVVSKKVKSLFRQNRPKGHWHVDIHGAVTDTYQSLTRLIPMSPVPFLEKLVNLSSPKWNGTFANSWNKLVRSRSARHQAFYEKSKWSDFKLFGLLVANIPSQSILHLGNSTPIRYHQLFNQRFDLDCYANRGTSGIDGCTSTAVGMASKTDKIVTLITGETSFLYDSNALWISSLPNNLRIIIINNQGGNIFRIIPGPETTEQLEEFFEATHPHNASGLAKTFDVPYFHCKDDNGLNTILSDFFDLSHKKVKILEIETPRMHNDQVLKEYFEFVSKEGLDT